MQIEKLLQSHNIPYVTEHKNVRDGWIGMNCPFCSGEGNYHLGYSLDEDYFSCWRCGGHGIVYSISKLLSISFSKAEELVEQYGGTLKKKRVEARVKVGMSKFKLPTGELKIFSNHRRYLEQRKFDVDKLIDLWGIMGTSPSSRLVSPDKEKILDYSNRILAPIFWDNRIVSFQTRDITNRHMAKYMACPPEREIISHKHILYGRQFDWGKRGICVEGITDVWRLGPDAFCTFGVKFTTEQVQAMVKHFDEVVVLFDPEDQAQVQAKKLIKRLNFKNVKAWRVPLESDPGEMSQDDADYLVKNLMK